MGTSPNSPFDPFSVVASALNYPPTPEYPPSIKSPILSGLSTLTVYSQFSDFPLPEDFDLLVSRFLLAYEKRVKASVKRWISGLDTRIRPLIEEEDIKQEVFFILARTKNRNFVQMDYWGFENYLLCLARHRLLAFLRTHTRNKTDFRKLHPTALDTLRDPLAQSHKRIETNDLIRKILGMLQSHEYRLFQYRLLGYSWEEIAQENGLSSDANRMVFQRASKRIRNHFGPLIH